jgi:hypothetical protein
LWYPSLGQARRGKDEEDAEVGEEEKVQSAGDE